MVKIMRIIIVYAQRIVIARSEATWQSLRLLHFVRNDIFEDVNFQDRSLKYSPQRDGVKPHPF